MSEHICREVLSCFGQRDTDPVWLRVLLPRSVVQESRTGLPLRFPTPLGSGRGGALGFPAEYVLPQVPCVLGTRLPQILRVEIKIQHYYHKYQAGALRACSQLILTGTLEGSSISVSQPNTWRLREVLSISWKKTEIEMSQSQLPGGGSQGSSTAQAMGWLASLAHCHFGG